MYHFFWYIAWHEMGYNRVKVGCTYGIYLKVVYTMWGIYHAIYGIFHAIKVAKEVCMDWTTGPALDGGAHFCLALFRSVTFKLKWLRLNGTMQQQRWHCGLELKGQWLSTHGTVRAVLLLALGHQSWWPCKFFISSHLLVWLWQFYKSEPKN